MHVLMPLPREGFDPSEAAVSWQILRAHGHVVVFATPDGRPAVADPVMLSGIGLDFWSGVPGLRQIKLVGALLQADGRARGAYAQMAADPAFRSPRAYAQLADGDCDALLLPGG